MYIVFVYLCISLCDEMTRGRLAVLVVYLTGEIRETTLD